MAINHPGDRVPFTSETPVPAYCIVKLGATPGGCALASAPTDALIGVSYTVPINDVGVVMDVVQEGPTLVTSGGTIAYGDLLTTDANGHAITAATGNVVIGRSMDTAVSGDLFVCDMFSRPAKA